MKKITLQRSVRATLAAVTISATWCLFTASAPFNRGDVFVGIGGGLIKHFSPSGVLLDVLNTETHCRFGGGMAFTASGHLLAIVGGPGCPTGRVIEFDNMGNLIGPFGSGYSGSIKPVVIDSAGHVYVGDAEPGRALKKFDSTGAFLMDFFPAREVNATNWIDLAADQCTMFYAAVGVLIKRFDVCANTQLSDFGGSQASPKLALRIRSNGEVLVAAGVVERYDAGGTLIQTYAIPGDFARAVSLDPDGTHFWTLGGTGTLYKCDISTGEIVFTFESWPFNFGDGTVCGLSVFGEPTAAVSPTPTPTASPTPTPTPTASPTPTFTPTPTPSPTCSDHYVIGQIGGTIVPGTTDIGNHGFDVVTTISLPFSYTLYDHTYTSVNVSTNGNAQFTTTDWNYDNVCLPLWTGHNYTIFPYWDDQTTLQFDVCSVLPGGTCGIYTSVSGSPPNRIFNIEWRTVYQGPWGYANYELRLYEGQTRFDVIYGTIISGNMITNGNLFASAGVQKGPSNFTQYFCDGSGGPATGGQSYILQPCGTPPPINQPPLATDDFYGLTEAGSLSVAAPGILANDNDPDNNPLTVELVTGPAHATSFQLNPDGSFSYTPPPYFYGEDTFTYRASDSIDSSPIATVHITVSQPGSAGFITGGGNFFQDGRKCTFGFVAKVQSNGVQGNLEFQDHDGNMDVKSQVMQAVYAGSSIDGYFTGTCTVNRAAGYTFFVQIHDRGEPGRNDDLTIWIFDSSNNLVYTAGALLSGGNIVIHDHVAGPTPTPTPTSTPTPTPTPRPSATPTPTGTPIPRHWWCDNDGDGSWGDYGFSATAPFGNCTTIEQSLIDYCDCDPNDTSPCDCP